MRLFVIIMLLFASFTYAFSAQAADYCVPHEFSKDVGGATSDCPDNSGTGNTSGDCADCCIHHHGVSDIIAPKMTDVSPRGAGSPTAFAVNPMRGHDLSGLLRPPRTV